MMVERVGLVLVLLCFPIGLSGGGKIWGQSGSGGGIKLKPSPGEEVEVYFLRKWWPGTVLQVEGNRVQAEFEFGSSPQVKVFPIQEVRYAWQARAISPVRLWKDASGAFSVRAAVMQLDTEAGTVTLYRIDENQEVILPIKKLGDAEQRRLALIAKSAPLRAPELPPVESFTRPPSGFGADWSAAETLAELPPDPPAVAVGVPMGGVAIPVASFFDELVGLFPIGSSAGWMVGGTSQNAIHGEEVPSRLVWATLADGKIRKQHAIPHGQALVGVHPASSQVLTLGPDEGNRATLTVWMASPKTDSAKPLVRWASQPGRFGRGDSWADFVAADRVIHRWEDEGYVVWDFRRKAAVYSLKQESFFGAQPTLSPGRRYLALPEDNRVRVLNAADGTTLAVLPIAGGRSSAVAFDPRGEKLAVLTHNQLAVWTLGSDQPPQHVRADLVGSPFGQTLAWVDDRSLLVDGKVLFDLELALPVWSYTAKSSEVKSDAGGTRTISVADGKLCYSVEVGRPPDQAIVIGAVELPGPMVRDVVAEIYPESLYVLRRGDAVGLEVDCGPFDSQVRSALRAEIERNGWRLEPGSPIVLRAEMGRAEQQSVTYENTSTGERQTVTVTPYFSSLQLRRGEETLWNAGSTTGLPSMVFLREGEKAQQKADEDQRPHPEFFEKIDVPEKVFDRRYQNGFGTSTYGSRGLSPKPLENLPR